MIGVALVVLLLQPQRTAACADWRDCRQQALAAAERGDYEAFHDLAWRAVQTGPPRDGSLLLLLARAQALSGRPHDALIMLGRLADMGVATDADTNPDFARTRQLPGWPEVAARIARLPRPDTPATSPVSTATTPAARPAPTPAPVPPLSPAPIPTAAPSAEAVRISTSGFALGGLAYDAVSERYLLGDRRGRKLIVVAKGSDHPNDFVRAESAGFHDIAAIEIDPKRGDLWVASTDAGGGAGVLHKLQLVSGRPLKSFPVAAELEPVTLVDLAVTPGGTVVVLDGGGQLLALRPGGAALERVLKLDVEAPASLAASDEEGFVYVAGGDGIVRADLRARTASRVSAAKSVSLARVERIRSTRRALIGVQADDAGARHIVRFDLNASGRAVTKSTNLGDLVAATGPAFVTISGDDLVYLADGTSDTATVAYRVRVR